MEAERYTFEQIFCGLRAAWCAMSVSDVPFTPGTTIDRYSTFDEDWDELDLRFVAKRLEWFFGFTCDHEEWRELFRLDEHSNLNGACAEGPQVTFGDLARFIAERTPVTATFEPVTVFGRDCARAGAFYGLQAVAEQVTNGPLKFAPSTRIHDVLRGDQLAEFWTQMRWRNENVLPALPKFWLNMVAHSHLVAFFTVLGSVIYAVMTRTLLGPAAVARAGYWLVKVARRVQYDANPLPLECVTFRDLAEWIVERRAAAA